MSYYDRPVSTGYYSFTKSAQMKKESDAAIKDIPLSRNRVREETAAKTKIEYILAHRRPIKTPYKVGDMVVYTRQINYGTKRWPWIVVKATVGYIVKVTDKTYLIGDIKGEDPMFCFRVNKEFVMARTK